VCEVPGSILTLHMHFFGVWGLLDMLHVLIDTTTYFKVDCEVRLLKLCAARKLLAFWLVKPGQSQDA
jgi:hypothetical protein